MYVLQKKSAEKGEPTKLNFRGLYKHLKKLGEWGISGLQPIC